MLNLKKLLPPQEPVADLRSIRKGLLPDEVAAKAMVGRRLGLTLAIWQ